jgi:hypothetical protein
MCVSTAWIWSCAALPAQCLLSMLHTVEDVLSLLGQYSLTALTRRAVASAHTVATHASALLQQTIIPPCSRAQRCELTVHRLPAHNAQRCDAPSWKQADLPWCQHTCPVWQWTGHALSWTRAAHLPVLNAVAGLAPHGGPSATSTWQGWPRGRPLDSLRRHVEAPDPFPGGKGGPGPRGQSGWTGP